MFVFCFAVVSREREEIVMKQNSYSFGRRMPKRLRAVLFAALAIVVALAMAPTAAFAADPLAAGGGGALELTVNDTAITVSWTDATGGSGTNKYQVYTSKTNNISTVEDAEANGKAVYADGSTGGRDRRPSASPGFVMGLDDTTDYYVNVVVVDSDGTKVPYTAQATKTGAWRFYVYEKFSDNPNPVLIKAYTLPDLLKLVPKSPGKLGFMQAGTSTWTIYGTDNYVKIEDLLADAGIGDGFGSGDTLTAAAPDGFASPAVTSAAYASERYFYPATTAAATSVVGKVASGSVLALEWANADIPADGTAGSVLNALDPYAGVRFFIGLSDANYEAKEAAGNRFATSPNTLTLTHSELKLGDVIPGLRDELKEKTDEAAVSASKVTALSSQVATLQKQLTAAQQAAFKGITASISSAKAGSKQATVKWKKVAGAQGYKIVYATSSKFKGAKTVTVKSGTAASKVIKSLKKGKTYYFKVRAYSSIGGTTVYTKYSTAKSAKIK
jgi:hypothetical protein